MPRNQWWTCVSVGLVVGASALAAGQRGAGAVVRFIAPDGLRPSTGYTHVVEVTGGRTIYIAGQVAIDGDGNLVGAGDFRAQVQQVYANLEAALASVGADFEHLVKTNTYVTDMSQLEALREVRSEYLQSDPPTSTLVQVVRLAREEFLLEIEGIAVVP